MKILSITSVYPTPADPGRGLFVRARLQEMGKNADVKLIVPVWSLPLCRSTRIPPSRNDGPVEVFHPGWLYLPGTGALTAALLFLQLIGPVRRLKREFAFQVIDSHFGYPDGIAAALLSAVFHVPFTVTLRGSELLHARYPLRRALLRWALRRASRVITVSEQLRRFAVDLGVDAGKTRTIPNGIDANRFFPRDRAEARRKHQLAPGQRIVLSAGHLIELKGHHYTIRAVKGLMAQGIPTQLLIAGGAPGPGVPSYERQLRRLIDDLGAAGFVRLLGHVNAETLSELMAAADVFCLASSREGWPNVVHEALACGAPVVATEVGAVPELLCRSEYGLIVPQRNPAALENALREALLTHWNGSEISAWAHSRSWEQVARDAVEELRQVVSEAPDINKALAYERQS
jgi:glycosyltransferase involved in cell wall biosynthesis